MDDGPRDLRVSESMLPNTVLYHQLGNAKHAEASRDFEKFVIDYQDSHIQVNKRSISIDSPQRGNSPIFERNDVAAAGMN